MIIQQLYRYPVKGLSAEPLAHVSLKPGYGFPRDREFALALASTTFDPVNPKPAPKTRFLMLMKNEALSSLVTRYNDDTDELTISNREGEQLLKATLGTKQGADAVEAFFFQFLPEDLDAKPRLVQSSGHQFTDVSVVSKDMMHAISLINLASVRSFEETIGAAVHPLRFRGNIYFDNDKPWSELDMVGQQLLIGDVPVEVVQRTRRCPATQVNPDTAERDINVPALLQQHYGHADMGIYAEIRGAGTVRPGDKIRLA